MSITHKRKRRNIFSQPSHQLKFSFFIISYVVLYFVILLLIIFLPNIVTSVQPQAAIPEKIGAYQMMGIMIPKFFAAFFITIVIVFVHALYLSHRIFGPLTRYSSVRSGVVRGGLYQRIRLRQSDLLGDMPEDFNKVIESYDNSIYEIKELLNLIDKSAAANNKEELRANIDKLKSKLSRYATTRENS